METRRNNVARTMLLLCLVTMGALTSLASADAGETIWPSGGCRLNGIGVACAVEYWDVNKKQPLDPCTPGNIWGTYCI